FAAAQDGIGELAGWRRPVPLKSSRSVLHHDGGTNRDAIIEVLDVLIGHAETTGRDRLADRLRLVGAVDPVQRRAEIHRASAERVLDAAGHVTRQIGAAAQRVRGRDRKSTRLNSSHVKISYAVFCLKKKKKKAEEWDGSTASPQ